MVYTRIRSSLHWFCVMCWWFCFFFQRILPRLFRIIPLCCSVAICPPCSVSTSVALSLSLSLALSLALPLSHPDITILENNSIQCLYRHALIFKHISYIWLTHTKFTFCFFFLNHSICLFGLYKNLVPTVMTSEFNSRFFSASCVSLSLLIHIVCIVDLVLFANLFNKRMYAMRGFYSVFYVSVNFDMCAL